MSRKFTSVAVFLFAVARIFVFVLCGQEKAAAPAKKIAVRAGHLIDGKSDKVVDNALILIEGDKIMSVASGGEAPAGVEVIDLSQYTVLPGLMDTHTHVLLN